MKPWKKHQLGILAVLSAAAMFGLLGCDLEELIAAGGKVEAIREITETYELDGLLDLNVESSNGYVLVASADTAGVSVRAILRSRADTLEKAEERVNALVVEMTQTGNSILLRYRAADQSLEVRNVSGVSFEVTVPAMADVEVDTSNGAITVHGVEGEFLLDTSNGAIEIADLLGVVHADTSNGRIDVQRVAGVLDLETSNGAIDIEDCQATVDAHTSNGRIDFTGVLVGDTHRLQTSNGAITVRIPGTESITFDASTSVGSISTNLPLIGDTSGRDWNAALNPPATKTLQLRTSNGSIRIEGI